MTAALRDAVIIIAVRDMQASLRFYRDLLGFQTTAPEDAEGFETVRRDGAVMHLSQSDDEAALTATGRHTCLHIWVEGLDALYDSLKPALDSLPEGRVRPPFRQPYGVNEFHVKDPDGCLIFFAEPD